MLESLVEHCRAEYPDATIRLDVQAGGETTVEKGSLLGLALGEAIQNAVVHSDSETPTVEVTVSMPADELRIEVADNGAGIPDAEWAIIRTGHETPLRHSRGLGLWLIYWAVTALGGELSRADNEPEGTVLKCHLPAETDSEPPAL